MDTNATAPARFPNLPERIRGLERLVYNLWWSWNRASREMFRALDLQAWLNSAHNPLRMLTMVSQENSREGRSQSRSFSNATTR